VLSRHALVSAAAATLHDSRPLLVPRVLQKTSTHTTDYQQLQASGDNANQFSDRAEINPQMTQQIKDTVKDFILREFLSGESPDSLDDSTPLITGGVLDSIATIKLIAFLEERFGIQIEPYEMNADYLNFLPDIAKLVSSRQAGGEA
jgi:acyl carrier protein